MTEPKIDPQLFDLYDEYCHSSMQRRDFLSRASALGIAGGVAGCAGGEIMLPNYARFQQVSFTDQRIKASYASYDSPGGNAAIMRGYLVQPRGEGPFPSVLVVHENRGLNPYVKDVARRAAVAGFLAFAPDALSAVGGYPGNDDDGKAMQRSLDRDKVFLDMINAARFVRSHRQATGKLGVTGFCFGGGVANQLAVELGADLQASAPFYGRAANLDGVPRIRATMLLHYAENDPRVNAMRPDYEAALKKHGVEFASHIYPGTRHGFHNGSTPRYAPEAAELAWNRTIDLFKRTLA